MFLIFNLHLDYFNAATGEILRLTLSVKFNKSPILIWNNFDNTDLVVFGFDQVFKLHSQNSVWDVNHKLQTIGTWTIFKG